MHLWYDTNNKKECLSGRCQPCETCDFGFNCKHTNCEDYEKYIKGQHIYHEGDIGSSLMGLISIETDELKRQITKLCTQRIRKKTKKNICFYDWLDNFSNIEERIGRLYDVFCLISPICYFYWGFIYRGEKDDGYRKKEVLDFEMKHAFLEFECIFAYINSCLKDNSFYDVRKYEFADRYYFTNDDRLNSLELDVIALNFEVNHGREVIELNNPQDFIYDLNIKYQTNKKAQDERFKAYNKVYYFERLSDFARISLYEILKAEYRFKKCENCGVAFIPYNRSDTMYCDRPSPQDRTKTCKEYGARQTYQDNLNSNEMMKLYRNIYMAKQMLVKRNPDVLEYANSFDEYKKQAKQFKADVKAGIKTESEYLEWLKATKEKRV